VTTGWGKRRPGEKQKNMLVEKHQDARTKGEKVQVTKGVHVSRLFCGEGQNGEGTGDPGWAAYVVQRVGGGVVTDQSKI